MTPIKYIGHRPRYREGAYGSGVEFEKNETKLVPPELAAKLLRHPDVYVPGEEQGAEVAHIVEKKDDDEDKAQDQRDVIAAMDKEALEAFAKTHFSVDLDKRKSVSSLRQHVINLVDQFGTE
jgi:hypothetical protein